MRKLPEELKRYYFVQQHIPSGSLNMQSKTGEQIADLTRKAHLKLMTPFRTEEMLRNLIEYWNNQQPERWRYFRPRRRRG